MKALNPAKIAPPLARYSHGVLVPKGCDLVFTSGQLGIDAEGVVPKSTQVQAEICFSNIDAILREGGATKDDVVRINAFVTDRAHMTGYMAARDEWVGAQQDPPASTLMIVAGFTRPEFTVEIEVIAAVAKRPQPKET